MAGRATGYGDFYKGNDKSPGDPDTVIPSRGGAVQSPRSKGLRKEVPENDPRKLALKRRLAMRRAGK